jgi:hypothetical protein
MSISVVIQTNRFISEHGLVLQYTHLTLETDTSLTMIIIKIYPHPTSRLVFPYHRLIRAGSNRTPGTIFVLSRPHYAIVSLRIRHGRLFDLGYFKIP